MVTGRVLFPPDNKPKWTELIVLNLIFNQMNNFIEPRNWWNRDYATEWWRNNGHFNDDLYLAILVAKEHRKNKSVSIKENTQDEHGRKQFIFFRFLLIRKWLGIERENMVETQQDNKSNYESRREN